MRRKSRRDQLRYAKAVRRCANRRKMGKPVFFTITHSHQKYKGFSNRYNYKANLHNVVYKGGRFNNVKFQASIITHCNFRQTFLNGIDFFNANLKNTSFKGAVLKNVIFFNCKFQNTDFTDTTLENVCFICSNLSGANGLNFENSGIKICKSYPVLELPPEIETNLLSAAKNPSIFDSRVLHVNSKRINQWILSLLIDEFGLGRLMQLSRWLNKKADWNNLYTVHSYEILLAKL